MIAAWIVLTVLGQSSPVVEKQIRVEPAACRLPAFRGEYPIGGEWRQVNIRVRCKR
jgi:hypothetical protein